MNNNNHLEQIRLVHASMLGKWMQFRNIYKSLKIRLEDVSVKRYFQWIDPFFYDKTGKIRWDVIRELMPRNIEKSIKREYDTLSENETRLCCLLLFDVPVYDIADILPYTQKSIYTVTNRIRKKTGMIDIRASLKKFVVCEEI